MKFTKYNSIENAYRDKFISKIRECGYDLELYVITEKCHGSNFSSLYDGKEIRYAKRTQIISESDSFMGFQTIRSQIESVTKEVYKNLDNTSQIQIFGELAGGLYEIDNDAVRILRNPQSKKVQKGVSYHPSNIFYIFDIKIDGEYMPFNVMMKVLASVDFKSYPNIIFSYPLFIGTFNECLVFKNDYPSVIYSQFNLPVLKDNICEGNVIKPYNKVLWIGDSRIILKNKNGKFKEKEKSKVKKHKVKSFTPLSKEQSNLLSIIKEYVTENRLRNVLSKIGTVTNKDFKKIKNEFLKDIIDDFKKDYELNDLFNNTIKFIYNDIAKMIRLNFVNIIDNNF